MFALVINQFKQQIEKEHIIEEIILELPFQNEIIKERMFICLEAIELKRIEREDSIQINYDYTTQREILDEILNMKKEFFGEMMIQHFYLKISF